MVRLAVAAIIAAAATIGGASSIEAQSKTKSTVRECKTKSADGKLHKWKCMTEQPCCFNAAIGKGVCGSPVIGCL